MSRRSRSELRDLMIDAGCELVRRRGLAFDPPSVTYANVFDHIEQTRGIRLHRSQVHGRIWDNQDRYRIDVAIAAIRHSRPGSAEVDQLVAELTSGHRGTSLVDVVEGWVAASIGVSRDGANADRRFDLVVAAQALSASGTATAPEIGAAASANLTDRMAKNEQRYAEVTAKIGLELDPVHGLEPREAFLLLARNSSALVEGARLVEAVDDVLGASFEVADGAGGRRPSDVATIGLTLLVEQLFGLVGNGAQQRADLPSGDDQPSD